MLLVMCIAWGVIMLFNLITLPVEFDASNRAKKVLHRYGLYSGARPKSTAVNQVLNAAALTYVAAFLTSLGYLLYLSAASSLRRPSRLSTKTVLSDGFPGARVFHLFECASRTLRNLLGVLFAPLAAGANWRFDRFRPLDGDAVCSEAQLRKRDRRMLA